MLKGQTPLALLVIAAFLFALASCGGTRGGSIQVKGSDTMVNLGSAWAEAYMAKHPELSIAVTGGGSGTGIAALINKTTDIAQVSREMKAKEYEQAKAVGVDPKEFVVAKDGLSVVVNPSNPVNELTIAQLSGIYTNKITNWKEVGGIVAPIVVLSRDTNSGTHVHFKEQVVQMRGLPTADKSLEYGPKVMMMPSSKTGVDEVAANPNAIFYVGLGYVTSKVKVVAIKIDENSPPVFPSLETVKSGEYPIARPLYFYTDGEPGGVVKDYIDWVLSPEGQRIVEQLDFIPAK
jgi:phosphate transport system substrate-binding protein